MQIVNNKRFFGKYPVICEAILKEDYISALDQMAEQLLSGKRLYDEETFLKVFLILAALENQAPAFVFGKVRLAKFYQKIRRHNDCLVVITELEEMGFKDHDEIITLRCTTK